MGFPKGILAAALTYISLTFFPGLAVLYILRVRELRFDQVITGSFAAGVAVFGAISYVGFLLKLPLEAVASLTLVFSAICFTTAIISKTRVRLIKSGDDSEQFAQKFVFSLAVASMLLAMITGSFRGWFEAWDYYSYIAMVNRFVSSGIVDNFPLAYANETPDPIHGYNIWALMWATISKSSGIPPVKLYITSAFLVVPIAIIAFYSMTRSLLANSTAAASATAIYFGYHVFYAGQAFLLRSTFYNADPAWLIFLPTGIAFAAHYAKGGKSQTLLISVICALATFMVHPFWGGMLLLALTALILGALIKQSGPLSARVKYAVYAAFGLFVLQYIPSVGLIIKYLKTSNAAVSLNWRILDKICGLGLGADPRQGALFLFVIVPSLVGLAALIAGRKSISDEAKRLLKALAVSVVLLVVFAIPRIGLQKGASKLIYMETSPYKSFVSDRLYVLNPFNLTFSAPDMTLYPIGLAGIFLAAITAAVLIFFRKRDGQEAGSTQASIAAVIMPLVALSPVLAPAFSSLFTVALLRRSLRLAALFSIIVLGIGITRLLKKWVSSSKAVVFITLILASIISYSASYMPVRPEYFRRLNAKMAFVARNLPRDNLVWHWEMSADKLPVAERWLDDGFKEELKKLEPGTTVFSDRFTSYRLPAYADVYVVARLKPGSSVLDQATRERDQALFFRHGAYLLQRTMILDKYNADYVLISMDLDYRLIIPAEDYYVGDPEVALELEMHPDTFKPVYSSDHWRMYRYIRGAAQ